MKPKFKVSKQTFIPHSKIALSVGDPEISTSLPPCYKYNYSKIRRSTQL